MLRRLDAELVHRGLARSRESAKALIDTGAVLVAGVTATKATTQVRADVSIVVAASGDDHYVSRGAHKLIGALDHFALLSLTGRKAFIQGATQIFWRIGARNIADSPGPVPDGTGERYIFSDVRSFTRPNTPPPPPSS